MKGLGYFSTRSSSIAPSTQPSATQIAVEPIKVAVARIATRTAGPAMWTACPTKRGRRLVWPIWLDITVPVFVIVVQLYSRVQ